MIPFENDWLWKTEEKVELGVHLIHEYVENMQFGHSKLGVRLIHECVLYTRRYGTRLALNTPERIGKTAGWSQSWFHPEVDTIQMDRTRCKQWFPSVLPVFVVWLSCTGG